MSPRYTASMNECKHVLYNCVHRGPYKVMNWLVIN